MYSEDLPIELRGRLVILVDCEGREWHQTISGAWWRKGLGGAPWDGQASWSALVEARGPLTDGSRVYV